MKTAGKEWMQTQEHLWKNTGDWKGFTINSVIKTIFLLKETNSVVLFYSILFYPSLVYSFTFPSLAAFVTFILWEV